ncbi:rab3 GTPase-activating protein non-catalytic subunit isoform X1 [Bombus vosnesenskii]|uniref:Rab3 GTPase-activating protein non-catalytic subunit isoform X1 n=1 Tax=Bombus vosnesenskii TaxID=207650 RepID=A0A6J3LAP8_9HYME|nr:rab3 GTPase-activating protein non-catalytic subunit isoform X1 [Bombus vosnesenskii]
MSCQIKGIANLTNTSNIKELLFGDSTRRHDIPQDELPLQDCFISLSSTGDVLAMANNTKMIILISRWDSLEPDEAKNKFHMIWYGEVAKKDNEWITSVICLPLLSLGKASSGTNPDWTCIIVGFNTGFIKFYTETGALLFGEQLHNEPVVGLKCQSFRSPKHVGDIGLAEEVHVTYNSVVCVLQGFPLFSTLRACRNYLARVQANCDDLPPITNLSYKKWGYKSQDIVNDSEVIGTTSVNSFDHLMTASICGGYNASYRSSAPQHNLVLVTGKRPFVGFHYALEGGSAPVLSDVAIAMASKLANAIGTAVPWLPLNWGNSKHQASLEASKTSTHEPVEPMTCRFGLSDVMREGYSIISSPNKALSVILDAMGRVLLVDNRYCIATRMWKGYRDAQCGWIEVEEEKHSGMHKGFTKFKQTPQLRSAFFLVIYAPKKGVIDIWSTQQGPKITTFTASKHGRLLYINYGLLGVNDNVHLSKNKPQYSCVFMDPLGGLKEITVPFHFALNSKNGKRARDIHILKKLKTFLREEDFEYEKLISEIESVCSDLKSNEIKVQTLEMLMSNKNIIPDALLAATNCFIKKLDEYEKEEMEPTTKTLYLLTTQLQQIINFYKHIKSQFDTPEYNVSIDDNNTSLPLTLLTTEKEVHRIFELFNKVNSYTCSDSSTECRVKFKEDGRIFLDFLSCFEFGTSGFIDIKKDIKPEKEHQISQLMYKGCVYSYDRIETWKEVAKSSNIQPFVFMKFALIYWLNKKRDVSLELELKQFTQLLNAICSIASVKEICAEHNEISLWWKKVRNILLDSTNPFNALTAALMCRAVAMSVEKYREKCNKKTEDNNVQEEKGIKNKNDMKEIKQHQDSINNLKSDDELYNLTNEWEDITKDTCQFTLLIGNLEDIAILDAIVSQEPPSDTTTQFFALPFVKFDISLGSVLSKGKGSVSEIVAKWITSTGIDPSQLVDTTDTEFDHARPTNDSLEVLNSSDEICNVDDVLQSNVEKPLSESLDTESEEKDSTNANICILERIKLLKGHFPYSLTTSVLLANICWEFAMSWNKDISQLKSLEAALCVLRQIPMKRMRHGVCCLLWSVHIKKRMEAVAKLINKLGKLPKERLCMQEIGLSDAQAVIFLQDCVTFLEIFIDSEMLEVGQNIVIKSEELWEVCTSGPQPFAALAIFQAPAWYDLIMLHLQLANVLHMIAHFNLKVLKPLNNLFDSVVQPYFFQSMADKVMLTWYRDDKRDNLRTTFLCRIINASMDFIHQETIDGKMSSSMQAIQWMSKCQTLASIWKISNDELRIHQVCQLYVIGFDRLAEEVVTAVNDVEKLAEDLLPIAGRRMMAYLSKSPDLLEEVSRISPALTKYLESLDVPDVIYTNCSNDDTIELIRRVSRHLPETHSNYHLAQLMLDAVFIYEGTT